METLNDKIGDYLATLEFKYKEIYKQITTEDTNPDVIGQKYGFLTATQLVGGYIEKFDQTWKLLPAEQALSLITELPDTEAQKLMLSHRFIPDDAKYFNSFIDSMAHAAKEQAYDSDFTLNTLKTIQQDFSDITEENFHAGIEAFLEFHKEIKPLFTQDIEAPQSTINFFDMGLN